MTALRKGRTCLRGKRVRSARPGGLGRESLTGREAARRPRAVAPRPSPSVACPGLSRGSPGTAVGGGSRVYGERRMSGAWGALGRLTCGLPGVSWRKARCRYSARGGVCAHRSGPVGAWPLGFIEALYHLLPWALDTGLGFRLFRDTGIEGLECPGQVSMWTPLSGG